jgi:hypothetical protein
MLNLFKQYFIFTIVYEIKEKENICDHHLLSLHPNIKKKKMEKQMREGYGIFYETKR